MRTRSIPRQAGLPFETETFPVPRVAKLNSHQERNREAGARILADPERYGGLQSLPVRWANLVLSRQEQD